MADLATEETACSLILAEVFLTLCHSQRHESGDAHFCDKLYLEVHNTVRNQQHKAAMGDATLPNNFGSSEKLPRTKEPENQLNSFNAIKQASDNDAAYQVGILQ